jgi:hypothetical protein
LKERGREVGMERVTRGARREKSVHQKSFYHQKGTKNEKLAKLKHGKWWRGVRVKGGI